MLASIALSCGGGGDGGGDDWDAPARNSGGAAQREIDARGAYRSSFAIEVPAFRGLEPQLALSYNSAGGDRVAGVGWELSGLSQIRRLSAGKGLPNYDGTDRFFLDGVELVRCTEEMLSPSCEFRESTTSDAFATKTETFQRIEFADSRGGGRWHVWSPRGIKSTYVARIIQGRAYAWELSVVRDQLGNEVAYEYRQAPDEEDADGERYIDAIKYNGCVIKFFYDPRPDPTLYATGRGLVSSGYRLKAIDVRVLSKRARTYALSYADLASTSRSLLTEVQTYGTDAELDDEGNVLSGTALPPTNFDYPLRGAESRAWATTPEARLHWTDEGAPPPAGDPTDYGAAPGWRVAESDPYAPACDRGQVCGDTRWLSSDVNGDGRADWVVVDLQKTSGSWRIEIHTARATAGGRYAFTTIPASPGPWGTLYGSGGAVSELLYNQPSWFTGDVNGDGMDDLLGAANDYNCGKSVITDCSEVVLLAAISNGDGTFRFVRQDTDWPWHKTIVYSFRFDLVFTLGYVVPIGPIVLSGAIATWSANLYHSTNAVALDRWFSGDVNGDGRTDLLLITKVDNAANVRVAFSTGSEFDTTTPAHSTELAWTDANVNRTRFVVADANADNMADVIAIGPSHDRIRFGIATSTGAGDFTVDQVRVGALWTEEDVWLPGDWNGDSRVDLLQIRRHEGHSSEVKYPHAAVTRWELVRGGYPFVPDAQQETDLYWHLPPPLLGQWSPAPIWIPADVDGDGRTDLIHPYVDWHDKPAAQHVPRVAIAYSHPTGVFQVESRSTQATWDLAADPSRFVVGDANGDGRPDILVAHGKRPVRECFIFCRTRFTEPWSFEMVLVAPSRRDMTGWRSGDVNGDGRDDAFYVSGQTDGLRIHTILRGSDDRFETDSSGSPVVRTQDVRSRAVISGAPREKTTFGSIRLQLDDPSAPRWQHGDIDGDGRVDLFLVDYVFSCGDDSHRCEKTTATSGIRVAALLSQGNGAWLPQTSDTWFGFEDEDVANWIAIDTDGDRSAELVHLHRATSEPDEIDRIDVAKRANDRWIFFSSLISQSIGTEKRSWLPADVNADGRGDLVNLRLSRDRKQLLPQTLVATADGQFRAVTLTGWYDVATSDTLNWRHADANGDGSTDFTRIVHDGQEDRVESLISIGTGRWKKLATPVENRSSSDVPIAARDWRVANTNGDSRADFIGIRERQSATELVVITSAGAGWARLTESPTAPMLGSGAFRLADTNGDAQDDIVRLEYLYPGVHVSTIVAERARDIMIRTRNGIGGEVNVTYVPSARMAVRLGGAQCSLPLGVRTFITSEIATRDGTTGSVGSERFAYECARWLASERDFGGWEVVRASRGASKNRAAGATTTRYVFTEDGCQVRVASTQTSQDDGWQSDAEMVYVPSRVKPPYICLTRRETVRNRDAAGNQRRVSTSYAYDCFGNVTNVIEHGAVASNDIPTGRDEDCYGDSDSAESGHPGADDRTITTTYAPNTAAYVVDLPANALTAGRVAEDLERWEVHRDVRFCYDRRPGPLGAKCQMQPQRGLLTSILVRQSDDKYLATHYEHDAKGNIERVTNPRGFATTFEYDDEQSIFPTSVCNALDHCFAVTWDRALGQPQSVTDQNAIVAVDMSFDALGRPKSSTSPDGQVAWAYPDWGDPSQQRVRQELSDGTQTLWRETFFDGLGRVYRMMASGPKDGETLAHETTYTASDALPYKESHWFSGGNTSPVFEVITYDAADRPLSVTHPDGSKLHWSHNVSELYSLLTFTDEIDQKRVVATDGHGRVAEVREHDGAAWHRTTYAYNSADDLVRIVDPDGNTVVYELDLAGRRTLTVDPDRGEWRSRYDAAGNVDETTDPRGTVIAYAHDAVDRLTSKTYPDRSTITFRYDEPEHGASIGRLTSVSDPSASGCPDSVSTSLVYHSSGEVASQTRCILDKSATFTFEYDSLRRPKSVGYPDGETVTYAYGNDGRLRAIPGYVDDISYDYSTSSLKITVAYANGVSATYLYDERGMLKDVDVAKAGDHIYDASYTYKLNGLVQGVSSTTDLMNSTYSYDGLGRVTAAEGDVSEALSYDAIGNIMSKASVGTYEYWRQGRSRCDPATSALEHAGPHAVSLAGSTAYTYDCNGNTVSARAGRTARSQALHWDFDNRLERIEPLHGAAITFTYDAFGERVAKTRGRETTRYYGDLTQHSRQDGYVTRIYGGGMLLAENSHTGRTWHHADHLGSTRVLTNPQGQPCANYRYDLFGEAQQTLAQRDCTTDRLFTGAERDAETGFVYLRSRYLDPRIGRFLSADQFIPGVYRPQTLNRYSYADNDPVSLVDRTGMAAGRLENEPLRPPASHRWCPKCSLVGDLQLDLTMPPSPSEIAAQVRINLAGMCMACLPANPPQQVRGPEWRAPAPIDPLIGIPQRHLLIDAIRAPLVTAVSPLAIPVAANVAGISALAAGDYSGARQAFGTAGLAAIGGLTYSAWWHRAVPSVTPGSVLLGLRDRALAVVQAEQAARGPNYTAGVFGVRMDVVFKGLVAEARAAGRLPATIRITRHGARGGGIDVYDTASGMGWDLTTATVRQTVAHDLRYLGRVMADGTVIRDVNPLVYMRTWVVGR